LWYTQLFAIVGAALLRLLISRIIARCGSEWHLFSSIHFECIFEQAGSSLSELSNAGDLCVIFDNFWIFPNLWFAVLFDIFLLCFHPSVYFTSYYLFGRSEAELKEGSFKWGALHEIND